MLEIRNLHASVDGHEILKGIDLTINAGEVHSIMGPNGSGKSTLAQVLAGRETYEVTQGQVLYKGEDLLERSADERACEGIFLAFQYPVEIPGVTTNYFLKAALNAVRKHRGLDELDAVDFLELVKDKLGLVEMDERLLKRAVHKAIDKVDFSGTSALMLESMTKNDRHQVLLDTLIAQLIALLQRDSSRAFIAQQIVRWLDETLKRP